MTIAAQAGSQGEEGFVHGKHPRVSFRAFWDVNPLPLEGTSEGDLISAGLR